MHLKKGNPAVLFNMFQYFSLQESSETYDWNGAACDAHPWIWGRAGLLRFEGPETKGNIFDFPMFCLQNQTEYSWILVAVVLGLGRGLLFTCSCAWTVVGTQAWSTICPDSLRRQRHCRVPLCPWRAKCLGSAIDQLLQGSHWMFIF